MASYPITLEMTTSASHVGRRHIAGATHGGGSHDRRIIPYSNRAFSDRVIRLSNVIDPRITPSAPSTTTETAAE